MRLQNIEIRQAIEKRRLKHYEVAREMGITCYTFSHWLQNELPEAKKKKILEAIQSIEL